MQSEKRFKNRHVELLNPLKKYIDEIKPSKEKDINPMVTIYTITKNFPESKGILANAIAERKK